MKRAVRAQGKEGQMLLLEEETSGFDTEGGPGVGQTEVALGVRNRERGGGKGKGRDDREQGPAQAETRRPKQGSMCEAHVSPCG